MKIAVLTSGGDAPGMNACVRAVVRYGLSKGLEICGVQQGYKGLVEDDIIDLDRRSVSGIIQRGGTFLQSARCAAFLERETRLHAGEVLRQHHVDGLIVIGGDGSFRGASALAEDTGVKVIGIPGTIDNDIAYTDYTIGFDTAVNNVLWAINSLRDTMDSHNRVTVVEVMGRHCGDIALHAGIAGGAEYILVPEVPYSVEGIAKDIELSAQLGKKSILVVLAEGAGRVEEFCEKFENYSSVKLRQTRLGYIQRGGSPTYRDRLLACQLGTAAVDLLLEGKSSRVVGKRRSEIIDMDIREALEMKKVFDKELYRMAMGLA